RYLAASGRRLSADRYARAGWAADRHPCERLAEYRLRAGLRAEGHRPGRHARLAPRLSWKGRHPGNTHRSGPVRCQAATTLEIDPLDSPFMTSLEIVIADDEPLARSRLRRLLSEHPG